MVKIVLFFPLLNRNFELMIKKGNNLLGKTGLYKFIKNGGLSWWTYTNNHFVSVLPFCLSNECCKRHTSHTRRDTTVSLGIGLSQKFSLGLMTLVKFMPPKINWILQVQRELSTSMLSLCNTESLWKVTGQSGTAFRFHYAQMRRGGVCASSPKGFLHTLSTWLLAETREFYNAKDWWSYKWEGIGSLHLFMEEGFP